MKKIHYAILRKASEIDCLFVADGEYARPAWELLNAKLIEGEPILNQESIPVKVIASGITVAGREELAKRTRLFLGWIFGALAVAIGTIVGAIINHLLGLK